MSRRRFAAALVGGLLALVTLSVLSGPATADQTGPGVGPGGYTVEVAVRFSGDAAPGGGGTVTVRVAPVCFWQPAPGPYTDAVAMLAWYDEVTHGIQTRGMMAQYGPRSVWKEAADAEKSGAGDYSWYRAWCRTPEDYKGFGLLAVEGPGAGIDPIEGDPTTWEVYPYRSFGAGEAVPPPKVDPAELARVARDQMVIPTPVTDRNPKIDAAGAPTLVGLPTWFWVTDPAAVGGATGTRTIRADLGAVWAQVVARTGGLHLDSRVGSTSCAPGRARTAYADGVPDTAACTVSFAKASVQQGSAGWRVTASTNWQADWTGSGGTGGGLDQLARQVVSYVPVAEVQNIVTR